jgi:hypothetical protein
VTNEDDDENSPILEEILNPPKSTAVAIIQEQTEDDAEFARENIRRVIQQGQDAMLELMDVSRSSGHPRAFEVLAKMMDTIVNANKSLLENKERDVKIKGLSPQGDKVTSVTNQTLVVTTTELLEMMKKKP